MELSCDIPYICRTTDRSQFTIYFCSFILKTYDIPVCSVWIFKNLLKLHWSLHPKLKNISTWNIVWNYIYRWYIFKSNLFELWKHIFNILFSQIIEVKKFYSSISSYTVESRLSHPLFYYMLSELISCPTT